MKTPARLTTLALSSLLLALCAAPSRAQVRGGGPITPTNAPNNPGTHQTLRTHDPKIEQTRTLKGKIERLRADENALVIRDEKTGGLTTFWLDEGTKFKADKGTDLAGRKSLSLEDFRAGQPVRLKYRPSDGKTLELRLRTDKG